MRCHPGPCWKAKAWSAAGLCFAAFASVDVDAAEPSVADAIRATLPKYDPKVREAHVSAQAAQPPSPQNQPKPIESDVTPSGVVTLPRITVRPDQPPEPTVALPRIVVRPPTNDVKEEAFLSPEARDARLVKKHLSSFDRSFLNRFKIPFIGQSNVSRAREAEQIEQSAKQLDVIADILQSKSSTPRDPEDEKKLKELYLDTFVSRPK